MHYSRVQAKIIGLLLFLCVLFVNFVPKEQFLYAQDQPASQKALRGEISAQPRFEFLNGQEEVLLLPSTSGLYIIKEGQILKHFYPGKEVTSLALIADQDSDGKKDLVVAFNDELLPNVLCLSSMTGETIWWFSPENKIFQEGFGWFDYQPEIVDIIVPSPDDKQYVYIAAGYSLYKIAVVNGNVVWEHSEPQKVVSVEAGQDLNGDQKQDLTLRNGLGEVATICGQTGEELWRKLGEQILDLPNGRKPGEELAGLKSLEQNSVRESYQVTDSKGRVLITGSPSELTLFDKEMKTKVWWLPRLADAGFLKQGDKTNELFLLYSVNQKMQGGPKIGFIQKISAKGDISWEYLLEPSYFANYSGIENTQICGDLDQDGTRDILGALSPVAAESNLPSKVIALSGKTGRVLWEANLPLKDRITALIPFQDVNGDESPEVLIGTSSHFYILDGASGKIFKDWPHYNLKGKKYFEPTKGIEQEVILVPSGDVNKDGLMDIFVVTPQKVRLGLTNRVGGIDFYFKELYSVPQGEIILNRAVAFNDINQDGIAELLLIRSLGNQEMVHTIISGADGQRLLEAEGSNPVLKATGVDFNSNGAFDIICYKTNANQERQFQVTDGASGNILWSYQGFSGDEVFDLKEDMIPGCLVEDLNSDGVPELAIIKNTSSGTGMRIEIFDIAGGWEQPFKTLNLQDLADNKLERNWAAGLTIQKVSQGAKQYLAISGRLGGRDEGAKLILYDYLEEKTVALYPLAAKKVNLTTDSLVVEDLTGKVRFLTFPAGNPTVAVNGDTELPLKLTWQNREKFVRTRIYVDDVLALETTAEAAELEITRGEHTIGVAQYYLSGRHSFQTIPVKVTGNSAARIITISLAIVLLGLVFGVPFYFKRRIGAGAGNG